MTRCDFEVVIPRALSVLTLVFALIFPPAAALAGDDVFTAPAPADPRCGEFGWNPRVQASVPVAWPQVLDLSKDGVLRDQAVSLADSIAVYLGMTGAFTVLGRDVAPVGGAITWISPLAFDYLGWRQAGCWMVVVAMLSQRGDGRVEASLSAYLTEEGNTVRVSGSSATVAATDLARFAGRFVDALAACITGVPGMLDTKVVYAKKPRGGVKEIWMTDIGSGQQTQVSSDGSLAVLPAWAPGGSVAWTGYAAGNPDIYVNGRPFGEREGMSTGIAFAPDGSCAALTRAQDSSSDIFLIDTRDGRQIARLTTSPGDDMSPAWSPDSGRIAFVSDRHGYPNIYVMNRDGSNQRALPIPGNYNTGPDWSPDGTKIVWQSRGERARFSIWSYDTVSGQTKKLSRDRYNDEEPSWSSDGRFIIYTSTRGSRKVLYMMNADGSGARPLFTDDADYFTPAWERRIPLPRH